MRMTTISARDMSRLGRWDAPHIIACVERGGDLCAADRYIRATTDKKGYGLADLVAKAQDLVKENDDVV